MPGTLIAAVCFLGQGVCCFGAPEADAQMPVGTGVLAPVSLDRPAFRDVEGDSADIVQDKPKTPLSMQDAIDSALRGNLSLVYDRYEPEKSAENIEIYEAVFEPRLNFSLNYRDRKDAKASSQLDGSAAPESKNLDYSLNIYQKLSTGAELKFWTTSGRSETNSTFSTLNPDYSSNVGFDITQPLLKGAGRTVNLASIAIAKSQRREAEIVLRKRILDTILNSEVAYWNLSTAYAFRDLRKSNLELARQLLEETRAKLAVGMIRRQDVLQAEANLALAQEQMISAEQLIEKNNDELLGSFGKLEFDNNPKFSVALLPQDDVEIPDFGEVKNGALAFDLDLQIAVELIERRKIEFAVADDNVNPTLNVRAGVSVLGREGDFIDSYKNALDGKGYSWNAGLDLVVPWGLREERARQNRAMLDLRQSEVSLSNVRQDLMLSLRLAYRDLEAGVETRRSAARTLELNVESYSQQKALYDVGLVTIRDVLQAQRDLDESKRRYLDAAFSVILARAKLSRLDGSILRRHGFNWGTLGEYELSPGHIANNN